MTFLTKAAWSSISSLGLGLAWALGAQNSPINVGPNALTSNGAASHALDGWAMLGWHFSATEPRRDISPVLVAAAIGNRGLASYDLSRFSKSCNLWGFCFHAASLIQIYRRRQQQLDLDCTTTRDSHA